MQALLIYPTLPQHGTPSSVCPISLLMYITGVRQLPVLAVIIRLPV